MTMILSDAATIAAARIVARLREEIDGPAEVEAVLCEDDATVLVYATTAGRTVTATAALAELGATSVADFARHLEARLGRPTLRMSA